MTVLPAAPADRAVAARTLAAAFAADPHTLGLLPPGDVETRLTRLFARIVTETLRIGGHVYLARRTGEPDTLGVAVWEAPGKPASTLAALDGLPTYLRVFGTRLPDAMRTDAAAHRHRPKVDHWYLRAIGTTPAARGSGAGAALIRDRLVQADAQRVGSYLESSTEHNARYYARFGFAVRSRVPAHGTNDSIGMWRAPGDPHRTDGRHPDTTRSRR